MLIARSYGNNGIADVSQRERDTGDTEHVTCDVTRHTSHGSGTAVPMDRLFTMSKINKLRCTHYVLHYGMGTAVWFILDLSTGPRQISQ